MKASDYTILDGEKINTISIDYCDDLEEAYDLIDNAEKFQVNGKYRYKYTLLLAPETEELQRYKVIGYYYYY